MCCRFLKLPRHYQSYQIQSTFFSCTSYCHRPVQSCGKLVIAALPCSLLWHPLSQPHLGQKQQGLMSSYLHCHLHQWQITWHVEQCNKCQHLRSSSFIFSPGNFRIIKIYGTSNVNRNSFHYHAETVLSSASATQICAQSAWVQPSTPCTWTNLMSRSDPYQKGKHL